MLPRVQFEPGSVVPLYRQLYEHVRDCIEANTLRVGEKLPPTRELAGLLGLNRATVSSAYGLLETEGLIRSEVGRGSFVAEPARQPSRLNWESLIPPEESRTMRTNSDARISFSASRPAEDLFPLEEFRETCREVIDSREAAQILQLGSSGGYAPLRHHLLEEARASGAAGEEDDILITSGCQQALDLIQRMLATQGETVLLEDPVYPGLRNVFQRGMARVAGVPVGTHGVDVDALGRTVEKERARLIVLTPNFQNPTGTTMPEAERSAVLHLARRAGMVIVENDLYGALRYEGSAVPSIKQLDRAGDTIFLSSFSKVAFPGLRVGWVIGPRHFIASLTEAKAVCDLHSDQLSQAVLLQFAKTGRLGVHKQKMLRAGTERLKACLGACAKELPEGSFYTKPEGGMNVWVRLPDPLDASELALRAEREGVSYLPGRYFAVSRPHTRGLRLSFAGLAPEDIRKGMAVLGQLFREEWTRLRAAGREPAPALV